MGGSGGGFSSSSNPLESAEKIRQAEDETQDKIYENDVNGFLEKELKSINERPVDKIKVHLETIKKAIESEVEGFLELNFGGSVSKHTYIDGLSDIDSLMVINNSELANNRPKEILDHFITSLKKRLPETEISKGNLAITIKFSDNLEIQILPALKTSTGYKIADPSGNNNWSNVVRPQNFANKLTQVNKANNNKVVPLIKIAKSIISSFPENRQLSGYHTESLAIEIFKTYSGPQQLKSMLKHFFKECTSKVFTKIIDSTGQSRHVDDYLGDNNSVNRKMASDSISYVYRKIQNADGSRNLDLWKSILK
jgi:hypothetical protein